MLLFKCTYMTFPVFLCGLQIQNRMKLKLVIVMLLHISPGNLIVEGLLVHYHLRFFSRTQLTFS